MSPSEQDGPPPRAQEDIDVGEIRDDAFLAENAPQDNVPIAVRLFQEWKNSSGEQVDDR